MFHRIRCMRLQYLPTHSKSEAEGRKSPPSRISLREIGGCNNPASALYYGQHVLTQFSICIKANSCFHICLIYVVYHRTICVKMQFLVGRVETESWASLVWQDDEGSPTGFLCFLCSAGEDRIVIVNMSAVHSLQWVSLRLTSIS